MHAYENLSLQSTGVERRELGEYPPSVEIMTLAKSDELSSNVGIVIAVII